MTNMSSQKNIKDVIELEKKLYEYEDEDRILSLSECPIGTCFLLNK